MVEAVKVEHVYKSFPGVLANNDVSISIQQGEVRAIIGENGAGKTTLMNILYGLYQPDAGKILVKGTEVRIPNERASIA